MRECNLVTVSSWQPRKCGIYTFAQDLLSELEGIKLQNKRLVISSKVAAIDNSHGKLRYRPPVDKHMIINAYEGNSWEDSAREIASLAHQCFYPTCVILQHEYGLDKTPEKNGYHRMAACLKERAQDKIFIVLSAHTVVGNPLEEQKSITTLADLVDGIVVPSKIGTERLASDKYRIQDSKLRHIAHGIRIYDLDLINPLEIKKLYGVAGRDMIGIPGFKSLGKGIDYSIHAFGKLINTRYRGSSKVKPIMIIAGECHEEFVKNKQAHEEFLRKIEKAISDSRLENMTVKNLEQLTQRELKRIKNCDLVFWDNSLDDDQYMRFNRTMDIASFLYCNDDQISSGNLAEAVGSRVAVMATQFPHAEELLNPGNLRKARKQLEKGSNIDARGIIIPFANKLKKIPSIDYAYKTLDFLLDTAITEIDNQPYTARQQIAINARKIACENNWENKARDWAEYIVSLLEAKFVKEVGTTNGKSEEHKTE